MASIDHRNICQPIQDQKNCGSCTAFGAIGCWEAFIKINFNKDLKLSEKDLFFCSGGRCDMGNTVEATLDYCQNEGVCSEDCCPYTDSDCLCGDNRCAEGVSTGAKLGGWNQLSSIAEMKAALNKSPLVGTMMVHESFLHYLNGVYHSLGVQDPILGGHCIAVVGYDDTLGAWLVRNSWGTGWGMQGYVWIQYGDSNIDSSMYQLDLTPQPHPSPCPFGNRLAKIGSFFAKLLRRKGRFFYLNP